MEGYYTREQTVVILSALEDVHLQCDVCGKTCKSECHLSNHMAIEHREGGNAGASAQNAYGNLRTVKVMKQTFPNPKKSLNSPTMWEVRIISVIFPM